MVIIRSFLLSAAASLTVTGAPAAQQAPAREPFPGLTAYVTKALADWKVPGLSLAIVRNDSVLYAKGFGVRRVGTNAAVDDHTLFEIGSSSKSFTATLVAMLVTEGKLRWDDRVSSHLPGFRLYDPVASSELTLRDALTHRSGLARGEFTWLAAGVSREEVLRRVRHLKPSWGFRTRWGYQNVMFLAAGEAVAKAAGSTWDDLLQQRIFQPLGMTSSVPLVREPGRLANFSAAHGRAKDSVYAKPHMSLDDIAPAGSIASNAREMAQWLRFQLGDGTFGGSRLVSAAALREIHTPQMLVGGGGGTGADSLTRFNTYGMGWFVQDYRGALVWQHGGGTDGMTTAMGLLPDHKFGVVVLSNLVNGQLPDLVMRWLFDRQLGAAQRDWSAEALQRAAVQRRRADSLEAAQGAQRVAGAAPPLPLTAFAGNYGDSLYGEGTISLESGRLMFARGDWKGPLEYWNHTYFRWGPLPSAVLPSMQLKFDVTADGKVSGLSFTFGQDVVTMARQEPPPAGQPGQRP